MTIFVNQNRMRNSSPLGPIGGLIALALLFVLLYFIARGVFTILSFVAPVLFLITLIMDYTVVTDYIKSIWNKLQTNFLMGLVMVLLTVFGFPIIAGYLFFKAYMKRMIKSKMGEVEQKSFAEYEVVEEDEEVYDDYLELPEVEEVVETRKKSSDYDNMFE